MVSHLDDDKRIDKAVSAFPGADSQEKGPIEQVATEVARHKSAAAYNHKEVSSTRSQVRARGIMRKNFFGVEEAVSCFGLAPSKFQLESLAEIPFDEQLLERSRDDHLLVAVFPLSILEISSQTPAAPCYAWYISKAFACDYGKPNWHLIRKGAVVGSCAMTWNQQMSLVRAEQEVPTARTMVYAIVGIFLATGERIFSDSAARCGDTYGADNRVYLGFFNSSWPFIGSCSDHIVRTDLGVAVGLTAQMSK